MTFRALLLALCLAPNIAFAPRRTFLPTVMRRAAPRATMETETEASEGGAIGHALIIQNKGGGHGEIGYHLAKALKAKDLDVTILQDSTTPGAMDKDALPFSRYQTDLTDALDVNIVYADFATLVPEMYNKTIKDAVASIEFDEELQGRVLRSRNNFTVYPVITHIFDNRAKRPQELVIPVSFARRTMELFNKGQIDTDFQMYTYISSAGMYEAEGKMGEDQPVDQTAATYKIEQFLAALFQPKEVNGDTAKWCAFRPQYIYGPYTSKRDYLDWFLARSCRELPMVVPGNGSQPVCVSHVEDVASSIACVVGKESIAGNNVFNVGTDELVTYEKLCEAAGEAFDRVIDVQYGPAEKSSFPFRQNPEGFAIEVEKLKWALDWDGPKHKVLDDIKGFYKDDYVALGLDKGDVDTSKDLTPSPEEEEVEA